MGLPRRGVLIGAACAAAGAARAEDRVFLTYTQSELDRAYTQSAWVPDAAERIARYATDSARVRKALAPRTERYGPGASELVDIFAPPNPGRAPIHVFFHGGAWTELSKDDASGPAPMFVDAGGIYIPVGFGNIPIVTLAEMVGQCRRALGWIHGEAASFGGNAENITISGHSSGGHLAAMMVATDWAAQGLPADLIKGGLLLSGVYDLYAPMLSSRRQFLRLNADEIVALSPLRHLDQLRCPVAMAWGDQESPEFKRQSMVMADALAGMGRQQSRHVMFNTNHFQMPELLYRPDTPLARVALELMGLG